ncbi:MAG: hypothetical protein NTU97_01485, partial [Candidatus Magasanikbacteria bacterium]|nr:hypothetical protein [Candidatus Magasanikbacteria bacterium]
QQVRQACSLAQDKPGNSTDNLLIEYFEESCPPTFAAIAVHLQSREVVSWSWRLDRRGEQSCPCDFTENEVTAMQYALANCKLHLLACSGNRPVTLLTPLVFYPFLID